MMASSKTISDSENPPARWLLRAIGVRLRFLLVMIALAILMTLWPWLRMGWDRWIVRWVSSGDEYAVSADSEFFCPMDPGILSAWPAICPICNMDLISRKKTDAVLLPEGVLARMQVSPYRVQLAGVRTVPVQTIDTESATLSIPVSAVVHRDSGAIVYVETMPGMFDALPVALGDKVGECYLIASGLSAGQRVVSTGAFLLDAETRLNPSLATQYFGANQQRPTSTPPTLAQRTVVAVTPSLTPGERQLIAQQGICPVTGEPLGSMGQPVFVTVGDRKVALCCKGCERTFIADSEAYFDAMAKPSPTGNELPAKESP